MTTTYDPAHAAYLDEADVRNELSRVFEVCDGCRRCATYCDTFGSLFVRLDRFADRDPGRLTPHEQDGIVDGCFECGRCAIGCPHAGDALVDVPRLVLRTRAMQVATGQRSYRERAAARVLASPSPAARVGARPGSPRRRIAAQLTAVTATRVLPPVSRRRFSTWFRARRPPSTTAPRGEIALLPTCLVEHHDPGLGEDIVAVYERNGFACASVVDGCCGAAALDAGDVGRFVETARRTLAALDAEVDAGRDVVVAQATCAAVIRDHYVSHLGEDARRVAERTVDVVEHLDRVHRAGGGLDTEFGGEVPTSVALHVSCHLRSLGAGEAARDLIALTGTAVRVVDGCAGVGTAWGYRASHDGGASAAAAGLTARLDGTRAEVVAGDCVHATTAIDGGGAGRTTHPVSLIARAYGPRVVREEPLERGSGQA